jgi:hypothetical protein
MAHTCGPCCPQPSRPPHASPAHASPALLLWSSALADEDVTYARARVGCKAQGLAEHVGRDRVAATVMPAVVVAGRDPVPNCHFATERHMQGLIKLVAAAALLPWRCCDKTSVLVTVVVGES